MEPNFETRMLLSLVNQTPFLSSLVKDTMLTFRGACKTMSFVVTVLVVTNLILPLLALVTVPDACLRRPQYGLMYLANKFVSQKKWSDAPEPSTISLQSFCVVEFCRSSGMRLIVRHIFLFRLFVRFVLWIWVAVVGSVSGFVSQITMIVISLLFPGLS